MKGHQRSAFKGNPWDVRCCWMKTWYYLHSRTVGAGDSLTVWQISSGEERK
ncbi:ribonucleotide reductase of class Ia alpha subunit [Salmonella phage 19]|nr:ribonucleotide reductase of class Ia alpha subunit [Salmonella phage 19]